MAITNEQLEALKQALMQEPKMDTGTPASSANFDKLLQELVRLNKNILTEMAKSKDYVENVSDEMKKLNALEKKEANPNKKSKDFDKALNSSKVGKFLKELLKQNTKERQAFSELITKKEEKKPSAVAAKGSQILTGSESFSQGLGANFKYASEQLLNLNQYQKGLLGVIIDTASAQAKYTQTVRAALFETANITSANKELFKVVEDIGNTTKVTGFEQAKAQENIVKFLKAGVRFEGNAVKLRDKLVGLTESQLSTEKQVGLEAGELFDTFNKLYQAGRLTEAEIADVGRGMRDIAKQTGLSGKNLQAALSAAQPILDAMKKASTLTSTAVKNITQGIAAAEKLGVTDQAKTLLEAASSSTTLFFSASQQTKSLLFSAAATVGKVSELQQGVLTRSKQGVKALAEGVTNVLKKFGVDSVDAIDKLSDSAKMKLNLNLKAAFGLELGEVRGVVESLTEAGKGYGERVADIEKKLKTNLTLEEKTAALEEKRRLQISQSLEALTVLDKAAVGAKNMDEALVKFGDRRKEFEKDLQALGLKGTNKEVIRGALNEAIRGIEAQSKKSLGITQTEIEKALDDPVSFRELSSKLSKAEQTSATRQKSQLDAITETNQKLEEIKSAIQQASSGLVSTFMSNAGPFGVIASSLALMAGPSLAQNLGKGLMNFMGKGGGAAAAGAVPPPAAPVTPAAAPVTPAAPAAPGGGAAPAGGGGKGLLGGAGLAKNILGGAAALGAVTVAIAALLAAITLSYSVLTAVFEPAKIIEAIDLFSEISFSLIKVVTSFTVVGTMLAGIGIGLIALGTQAIWLIPALIAGAATIGLMSMGIALFVNTVGSVLIKQAESMENSDQFVEAAIKFAQVSLSIVAMVGSLVLAGSLLAGMVAGLAILAVKFPLVAIAVAAGAAVLPFVIPAIVKFINSIGNSIIVAANTISGQGELEKAADKLGNYVSAGGRAVSSIMDALWDMTKLSVGGGFMTLGTTIASAFGASPQENIRKAIRSLFDVFNAINSSINASETATGITPESLDQLSSKIEKYRDSNKRMMKGLNELSESFNQILGITADATLELSESTKTISPTKLNETLSSAKSMTALFGDFVRTGKEFEKDLNPKTINSLKNTLGDTRLPEVLKAVFANVANASNVAKEYRFSKIELKALSEKLVSIGSFVKGVGDAAKGIKEVNSAFDEIKKSSKTKGKDDFAAKQKELEDFLKTILNMSFGMLKIAKENKDLFGDQDVGEVIKFTENLSLFLDNVKLILTDFNTKVTQPIQELANNPNVSKLNEGEIAGVKGKFAGVDYGFASVMNNVSNMFFLMKKLEEDLQKQNADQDLDTVIKNTTKFTENITKGLKAIGSFLNVFNGEVVQPLQELANNPNVSKITEGEIAGVKGKFAGLDYGFASVMSNVSNMFYLGNKTIDELKKQNEQGESSFNKIDELTNLISKIKLFNNFLSEFGFIVTTLENLSFPKTGGVANLEKKVGDFKAKRESIIKTLENIQGTFFEETFLNTLKDFAGSIPTMDVDINAGGFLKFATSLGTFIKSLATTFTILDEPINQQNQGKEVDKGKLEQAKKTIADQIRTTKEFFSGDFLPLLQEFGKIINTLDSANFSDKKFEKVGKTMEGFGAVIKGIEDLIVSFGVIGYELESTSITTNAGPIKKTRTTLEFMRDLLSSKDTNEFAKLMRDIPAFIYNNIVLPMESTPVPISPKKIKKTADILESTVKIIDLVAGKNGLTQVVYKLNPKNIKDAIKALQSLKEVKTPDLNSIYGEKTSYLLADFIKELVINVINPLSILNQVTSPRKLDKTAKILTAIASISNDLPKLVNGMNKSIQELTKVDDSNFNMMDQVIANLEVIGSYLPDFAISLYTNFILPLSIIPLSPKALNKIADKINAITKITTDLPVLVENLNTKLPNLMKNIESIDANLSKKFGAKGQTMRELLFGLLGFIMQGVVAPLLMTAVSPKLLARAASQINSLASLVSNLGPVFIGFFQGMEELLGYIDAKYGKDASAKIGMLAAIFDNDFFKGNFITISDTTVEGLKKLLVVQQLMDQIKGFNIGMIADVFKDVDMEAINANPLENSLIKLGEQLDRIIEIMKQNADKINEINSLGSISTNNGDVSTAATANLPDTKSMDMFSQSLQMKESASTGVESADELSELNDINSQMNSKQDEIINLLSGILQALSLPIASKSGSESSPFEQNSSLQNYNGQLSAKLQTGTINRSDYIKGSNVIAPATGAFT